MYSCECDYPGGCPTTPGPGAIPSPKAPPGPTTPPGNVPPVVPPPNGGPTTPGPSSPTTPGPRGTYCGDGTVQAPNDQGQDEECDGSHGQCMALRGYGWACNMGTCTCYQKAITGSGGIGTPTTPTPSPPNGGGSVVVNTNGIGCPSGLTNLDGTCIIDLTRLGYQYGTEPTELGDDDGFGVFSGVSGTDEDEKDITTTTRETTFGTDLIDGLKNFVEWMRR